MPTTPFQIDYTNKDYEAFRNMMINAIPMYTPEWTDTSESDFGIIILELLSHGLDILSYYQDRALNEAYLPTAQLRKSVIKLTNLVGYTLSDATPAKCYVVFTLTSPAPTGGFTIFAGTQVSTQPTTTEQPIIFETDSTFTIPAGKYGNEKDGMGNYLYQTSATQGETIYNEVLGSSNGAQSQQFTMNYSPVINDSSLKVYVINSAGIQQQWNSVTDFINSQPTDQAFTVELDENSDATITFGSGSSGAIPDVGFNNITATYRIGGGTLGNVGATTLTNLMTPIAGVSSVTNPASPYQLGTDMEDINVAKVQAPIQYRTNQRAVTLQDYSDLVISHFKTSTQTPILNATAVNGTTWDYDIVVYAIRSDLTSLTSTDMSSIQTYLNSVRMITNKVTIQSGTLVPVTLTLSVQLYPTYAQSSVTTAIQQALLYFIQTSNFNFGENLLISQIISTVSAVAGVMSVAVTSPTSDIVVAPTAIIQSLNLANLTLNVTGGVLA